MFRRPMQRVGTSGRLDQSDGPLREGWLTSDANLVALADLSKGRFRPIFSKAEKLGPTGFMHPPGFTEARSFGSHDRAARRRFPGSILFRPRLIELNPPAYYLDNIR